MKQIVSNYSYSPTTNVVTLTGVNIEQDQLLLVVAPQVGRTMYNFASGVTGVVSAGVNTRVTLNASTAGLTTTSPLVIFYDDHTSTQTVAGTVTANVIPANSKISNQWISANYGAGDIYFERTGEYTWTAPVGTDYNANIQLSGSIWVLTVDGNLAYNIGSPFYFDATYGGNSSKLPPSGTWYSAPENPVQGSATIKHINPFTQNVAGAVTVGNSVTIGSLPAISGTVTARLQDASGNNLTSTSIGGVQRLNVSLASAATPGGSIPTFVNVYGGSDSGTVRALAVDSSGRTVVTVSNFPATQPVSLASTTVTVSALPSGALTTRFGSVTTANTAQITSAVTNTSRKYLLAQNISAGTVTIGIGFSPTTTQGIQLTAGGGLTFDTFCPTGAVYWLGAVTGAAFTILEG